MNGMKVASRLREEATRQGLMAFKGVFAVPAVIALSTASWAMYAVAFLERAFETLQRTADEIDKARDERDSRLDWEGRERPETSQPRA